MSDETCSAFCSVLLHRVYSTNLLPRGSNTCPHTPSLKSSLIDTRTHTTEIHHTILRAFFGRKSGWFDDVHDERQSEG